MAASNSASASSWRPRSERARPREAWGLGQIRVEVQRAQGVLVGGLEVLLAAVDVHVEVGVGVGQSRVGRSEVGISFDGLAEHAQGDVDVALAPAEEEVAALEVVLVGQGGRRCGG